MKLNFNLEILKVKLCNLGFNQWDFSKNLNKKDL